jgi:hypothetical protein
MKKTLLIIVALVGFACAAVAQPKALGIRIGNGVDVSYENYAGGSNFMEFELGLDGYHGSAFHVDGLYNLMIAQPSWTSSGSWGFYGGPGAGVAVWNDSDKDNTSVYAGIIGNLGLEYTFDFPLQLSIDVRPRIMFGDGGVWSDGILSFGLGVRYAF